MGVMLIEFPMEEFCIKGVGQKALPRNNVEHEKL